MNIGWKLPAAGSIANVIVFYGGIRRCSESEMSAPLGGISLCLRRCRCWRDEPILRTFRFTARFRLIVSLVAAGRAYCCWGRILEAARCNHRVRRLRSWCCSSCDHVAKRSRGKKKRGGGGHTNLSKLALEVFGGLPWRWRWTGFARRREFITTKFVTNAGEPGRFGEYFRPCPKLMVYNSGNRSS